MMRSYSPSGSDPQRLGPVRHQLGLMLLLFEAAFDVLTDRAVVFDDENLHSAASSPYGEKYPGKTRTTAPAGCPPRCGRRCSATMP